MSNQIYVVYPNGNKMSKREIISAAKRFYDNDDVDLEAKNFEDAVKVLSELGYVTIKTYLH